MGRKLNSHFCKNAKRTVRFAFLFWVRQSYTLLPIMPSSATQTPAPSPLFGRARRLLGWQGYLAHLPANWNPGKFAGKRSNGDVRVDDEDGTRLELRWEETNKTPDVARSVDNFLGQLEKAARKSGDAFERDENAHTVSRGRKRKEQVTSFGWIGAPGAPASCGYGAAWSCPVCKRVTFAHVIGHANEKPAKIMRLASEILSDMECHGEGGWDTWAAFDLQIEIPTEFELKSAQLLLNKIDIEWVRPRPNGLYGWGRRAERLRVQRFSGRQRAARRQNIERVERLERAAQKQRVGLARSHGGRVQRARGFAVSRRGQRFKATTGRVVLR